MTRWGFVLALGYGMAQAEVSYFHSDHLGSMAVATNSAGVVRQVEHYTPFGETVIASPAPPMAGGEAISSYQGIATSPRQDGAPRDDGFIVDSLGAAYLFTGQELDHSSDLSYYGARYYDFVLGRFASTDPVFDDPNPYAYVRNNPVLYSDPTGEVTVWDVTDVAAFMINWKAYQENPTGKNAFWVVVSGVGLLPIVPSGGYFSPSATAETLEGIMAVGNTLVRASRVGAGGKAGAELAISLSEGTGGSSSASPERRKPTSENGYYGPEGGWPNGRAREDRANMGHLGPMWGKSNHPILQEVLGSDGLIYGMDGEPLQKGLYIFNIDAEGNIYFNSIDLAETPEGRLFGHTSLTGGENSFGAGYFSIQQRGILSEIVDYSGHYSHGDSTFGIQNFGNYLGSLLDDTGVAGLSEVKFVPFLDVVGGGR